MSTPAPSSVPVPVPGHANRELKLISHSPLFYWWPVWAFGFFMAGWTYFEDNRALTVPADAHLGQAVTGTKDGKEYNSYELTTSKKENEMPKLAKQGIDRSKPPIVGPAFPTHMSQHAWLGSIYITVLLLVIIITNVPLRGLWSFLVIIMVILISLVISLFHGWDDLLERGNNLKIYINLAGYLTISTVVFILWLLATFVFDRRAYVIFTPGQIKVCEHIGDSVKTFDTVGVTFEKQRDDLFRHYILGFGSGDLILKTAGADRHTIKMPNVLGIGWQLQAVENMLRERAMTTS